MDAWSPQSWAVLVSDRRLEAGFWAEALPVLVLDQCSLPSFWPWPRWEAPCHSPGLVPVWGVIFSSLCTFYMVFSFQVRLWCVAMQTSLGLAHCVSQMYRFTSFAKLERCSVIISWNVCPSHSSSGSLKTQVTNRLLDFPMILWVDSLILSVLLHATL